MLQYLKTYLGQTIFSKHNNEQKYIYIIQKKKYNRKVLA